VPGAQTGREPCGIPPQAPWPACAPISALPAGRLGSCGWPANARQTLNRSRCRALQGIAALIRSFRDSPPRPPTGKPSMAKAVRHPWPTSGSRCLRRYPLTAAQGNARRPCRPCPWSAARVCALVGCCGHGPGARPCSAALRTAASFSESRGGEWRLAAHSSPPPCRPSLHSGGVVLRLSRRYGAGAAGFGYAGISAAFCCGRHARRAGLVALIPASPTPAAPRLRWLQPTRHATCIPLRGGKTPGFRAPLAVKRGLALKAAGLVAGPLGAAQR